MTTAPRPGSHEPPSGTHCEWCGADFETPPGEAPAEPRARVAPATPEAVSEGETHCEWCGAEYPLPRENG